MDTDGKGRGCFQSRSRQTGLTQTIPVTAHRTVMLNGVDLACITEAECVQHVLSELDAERGGWIITPNLDILLRCHRDKQVMEMVGQASLRVADGMPLIWASRLQGTPLPQRVAGSSLISSLSAGAATGGRSVFLLGGDEGTASSAAEVLKQRFPGLRVCGTYYPPMGFEKDESRMAELVATISRAQPDIVFVALGFPKQERLIRTLMPHAPKAWWVGVGISFSFLCGEVKRAPRWMQKCGLEWVHRLWQEPRRLARRYLIDDLPFAAVLFTRSFFRRFCSPKNGGSGAF